MKMLVFMLVMSTLDAMENKSDLAQRRQVPQLTINVDVEEETNTQCCVNIKSTCDKDELSYKIKMGFLFLTSAGIIATTTAIAVHYLDKCS